VVWVPNYSMTLGQYYTCRCPVCICRQGICRHTIDHADEDSNVDCILVSGHEFSWFQSILNCVTTAQGSQMQVNFADIIGTMYVVVPCKHARTGPVLARHSGMFTGLVCVRSVSCLLMLLWCISYNGCGDECSRGTPYITMIKLIALFAVSWTYRTCNIAATWLKFGHWQLGLSLLLVIKFQSHRGNIAGFIGFKLFI